MAVNNSTAQVKMVLKERNELVVTFESNAGTTSVIPNRVDQSDRPLKPGDIIKVTNIQTTAESYADELICTANERHFLKQIAVVKKVLDDKVILRTKNGSFSSEKLPEESLSKGNTVELDGVGGILRVLSEEPVISFGLLEDSSNTNVSRYIVSPEEVEESFEDIGGLDEVIKKVKEVIELPLKHSEKFEKVGIDTPSGILFYGKPGTGKTLTARAVAKNAEATFYAIKGPELASKWYGETEQNLREIFEDAKDRDEPSIIFFDEMESLAGKRKEARDVDRRIIAQLLTLMEGFQDFRDVIVIGATNRPEDLDPALRRPGRFDLELEFPVPDNEGRLDILQKISKDLKLEGIDLTQMNKKTKGYTGADLDQLLRQAGILAVKDGREKIMEEDLLLSFGRISSDKTKGDNNDYH